MLNLNQKDDLLKRLRRAGGQVEGIQRMVENDRYCNDVLVQFVAVQSALSKAARLMLSTHVDTCVAHTLKNGTKRERAEKLDELFDMLGRFGKL